MKPKRINAGKCTKANRMDFKDETVSIRQHVRLVSDLKKTAC